MFEYDKQLKLYKSNTADRAELDRILAYATGFFEADGHSSFYITGHNCLGNVSIEQKDLQVLKWFAYNFQGKISLKKTQSIFTWQIYGHQAKAFYLLVEPFMIMDIKRARALRFIKFFSTTDFELRKRLVEQDRRRADQDRERLSEMAR